MQSSRAMNVLEQAIGRVPLPASRSCAVGSTPANVIFRRNKQLFSPSLRQPKPAVPRTGRIVRAKCRVADESGHHSAVDDIRFLR